MPKNPVPKADRELMPGGTLTEKQAKFVSEVVRGKSLVRASKEAGYAHCAPLQATIRSMGLQLANLMDRMGYTPKRLMALHIEGLETADLTVRRHYLDMAYRLRGFYRESEIERGHDAYRRAVSGIFGKMEDAPLAVEVLKPVEAEEVQ